MEDSTRLLICCGAAAFAACYALRCLQVVVCRALWEPVPALLVRTEHVVESTVTTLAPSRMRGVFAVDIGGGEPRERSERFGWLDAAAMPVGTVAAAYVCPRDPSRVLLPTWGRELRWRVVHAMLAAALVAFMGLGAL